jgi:hypothetical protein
MKEITITIKVRSTDEYYDSHIKPSIEEIKSGKLQREMKEGSMGGITKVTATQQVINIREK